MHPSATRCGCLDDPVTGGVAKRVWYARMSGIHVLQMKHQGTLKTIYNQIHTSICHCLLCRNRIHFRLPYRCYRSMRLVLVSILE
jgi:hypothetical protein